MLRVRRWEGLYGGLDFLMRCMMRGKADVLMGAESWKAGLFGGEM